MHTFDTYEGLKVAADLPGVSGVEPGKTDCAATGACGGVAASAVAGSVVVGAGNALEGPGVSELPSKE